MEIRPINPEEKVLVSKIQSIAFLFSRDFSKAKDTPEEFCTGYETGRAAFDDNGKLCSCLELIPYQVRFDGHTVGMGGIGGVASLPEERKKRYIRNIFTYCMEEMYQRGDVFSYLYPFSHPYYRKFGYELNMFCKQVRFPLKALSQFPMDGSVQLYTPDMDPQVIYELYHAYIADKNLAVVREEKHWSRFLEKDPYKDNDYLYTWYDEKGQPGGYICYGIDRKNGQYSDILVKELIWVTDDALRGILGFMKTFVSQLGDMIWKAPVWLNLHTLFPEPYEIRQEIHTGGMNRIVNVQKALRLLKVPADSGRLVLDITDAFFPRNTGIYELCWENGGLDAAITEADPDLSCDVQALSQLLTGFASIEDLLAAGKIQLYSNKKDYSVIFRSKKLFINDAF